MPHPLMPHMMLLLHFKQALPAQFRESAYLLVSGTLKLCIPFQAGDNLSWAMSGCQTKSECYYLLLSYLYCETLSQYGLLAVAAAGARIASPCLRRACKVLHPSFNG